MESYQISNFNKISFYENKEDEVPQLTKSILFSSYSNNELLGMMNADFIGEERNTLINLMDSNGLTEDELEVISTFGMMQIDEEDIESSNDYESYLILPDSKLIVLKVDKNYNKIKLFNSNNVDLGIELILTNSIRGIPQDKSVYKYVVICQAGDKSSFNPSVSLHENSDYPHSNLGSKILLAQPYYDLVILPEVIDSDKIFSVKSNTELGVSKSEYAELSKKFNLSVDENYKLTIGLQ